MCLRAGVIGSISAWFPSRRSVDSQRGARVMRLAGQVRSAGRSAERPGNGRTASGWAAAPVPTGDGCRCRKWWWSSKVLAGQGWGSDAHRTPQRGGDPVSGPRCGSQGGADDQPRPHHNSHCGADQGGKTDGGGATRYGNLRRCLCSPSRPTTPPSGALVEIRNAGQRVDDPEAFDWLPEAAADELRYGWDMQPGALPLCAGQG